MGEYELAGMGADPAAEIPQGGDGSQAAAYVAGVSSTVVWLGWLASVAGGFMAGRALARSHDKQLEYGAIGALICAGLGPAGVLGLGVMAAVVDD